MVRLERSGRPPVGVTAPSLEECAPRRTAATYGIPDLPLALVPECLTNCPPERVREFADDLLAAVAGSLTRAPHRGPGGPAERPVVEPQLEFSADDPLDAVAAMNRRFL